MDEIMPAEILLKTAIIRSASFQLALGQTGSLRYNQLMRYFFFEEEGK
jgi:hypothetical protein